MKIIHIEDYFHPNAGYQVNVLAKFMAKEGHDVTVITSEMNKMPKGLTDFFGMTDIEKEDEAYSNTYHVKIVRVPLRAYISGRSIYKCKVIWELIDELRPDVLYVHGSDTYIAIRVFLRLRKFPCAIISDNHMVDIASNNKYRNLFRIGYRFLVTPIIKKNNIPIIRTADVDYIMKRFGIPKQLAPVVSLGTDTMLFHPDRKQRIRFRRENALADNAFIILYAGKLDESKGGLLLAELTNQMIRSLREIIFVVIGNTVGEYGEKVETVFSKSIYKVLRFPTQAYANLAQYYQSADIAVIPAACSLSIFDFAASGLPVVAEDNETNVIRTQSLGSGAVFESGNVKSFVEAVETFANMEDGALEEEKTRVAQAANDQYGYDKQYKKYMRIIKRAVQCRSV